MVLEKDIKDIILEAEAYCTDQGLALQLVYELPESVLDTISERSKAQSLMYFTSKEMLKDRLKNGCYILKESNDKVVGHIFAHKHWVNEHAVYERASLWVKKEYRNFHLGLLLMHNLTELYKGDFVISIARATIVHHNNELLGMKFVMLSQMSKVLVDTLEKIGKLRDEVHYKYYVNPYFESHIRELK